MCGGDFMNKNPDEAFQFLDYVAEGLDVQAKYHYESARHVFKQANALGHTSNILAILIFNTYNPGWRNHPNLSWREVTMASFNSKETDFRVIRLMDKVFNHKKAFTEQVVPFENKAMVKYKDQVSYHLSPDWRLIRGKALLDLGASVNLLPYSIYKQLGLGELKATTLHSLVDHSIKVPRSSRRCLVQVEKFYYQWTLWY
ncbi:hypothetical protein CK203_042638 [Vitis vinifera]|uniref:Uncharacterized protein n=1 Tax=Vitis vinifera TaxID=29760 RepID=A0A438I6U8_VITVI|nr:hypothetical protein CK203_042638 [Vitis vinifera]